MKKGSFAKGVREAEERNRMDIETARLLQDVRDINTAGLEGKKVDGIYLLKDPTAGGFRIHVTFVERNVCLAMNQNAIYYLTKAWQ